MTRSIHTTYKDLKVLTKKELEEHYNDLNLDLMGFAKKSSIKKKSIKREKHRESLNNYYDNTIRQLC